MRTPAKWPKLQSCEDLAADCKRMDIRDAEANRLRESLEKLIACVKNQNPDLIAMVHYRNALQRVADSALPLANRICNQYDESNLYHIADMQALCRLIEATVSVVENLTPATLATLVSSIDAVHRQMGYSRWLDFGAALIHFCSVAIILASIVGAILLTPVCLPAIFGAILLEICGNSVIEHLKMKKIDPVDSEKSTDASNSVVEYRDSQFTTHVNKTMANFYSFYKAAKQLPISLAADPAITVRPTPALARQ